MSEPIFGTNVEFTGPANQTIPLQKPSPLICGKTHEEIRKAFFTGKINKLLDEVSAERPLTDEDLKQMTEHLEILQVEKRVSAKLADRFESGIAPPSADNLFSPTEEEKKEMENFLATCKSTMKTIREIIEETRKSIERGDRKKRNDWLDLGLAVVSLMFSVDQYEIVHERLYKYELTKIIDNFKVSRLEAEERAKLTPAYRQYREAQRLKEQIIEFELLAKKYAGIE